MRKHLNTIIFWTAVALLAIIAAAPAFSMEVGTQVYLDNAKATGGTWAISWQPFANETQAMTQAARDGITYARCMVVCPNVDPANPAAYKAYDGRPVLDHWAEWQALGIRTVIAPRDYWLIPGDYVARLAALDKALYRACRARGINPVLELANEPDTKEGGATSPRLSISQYAALAQAVIPELRAEFPDLEWWGSSTASIGWWPNYYSAVKGLNPSRRTTHIYEGCTDTIANEVTCCFRKVSNINASPWGNTEFTPYATSGDFDAEMTRCFNTAVANKCNLWFLWALNVPPHIYSTATTLRPYARAVLNSVQPGAATPTPAPITTATPTPNAVQSIPVPVGAKELRIQWQ